jgi:hypothetical protein
MWKLLSLLLLAGMAGAQGHLVLTEVCVTPNEGEFIEIYNNGSSAVDLTNYYICDLYGTSATVNTFYPRIVAGAVTSNANDFLVRFPAGTVIAPAQVMTLAMSGSMYQGLFGSAPTFELLNTGIGIQMLTPPNGFIGSAPGLTNGDEVVMLFYWDGANDRTYDIDYALWGDDLTRRVEKTGISLDGPDGDTVPTPYMTDTASASQSTISTAAHAIGSSFQRVDMSEGTEVHSGGNGYTGHDETSEDMAVTWTTAAYTPGVVSTGLQSNTWAEIKALYQD